MILYQESIIQIVIPTAPIVIDRFPQSISCSTGTLLKRWPPLAVFGLRSPERLHEECGDTTGLQQGLQRLYLPKDRNIEGFRNTLSD